MWNDLRDARVLVTGASGFVGSWLLETLVHANTSLRLGIHATALVRDRVAFAHHFPHLTAAPAVHVHVGDVRVVAPPPGAITREWMHWPNSG